MTTVNTLLSGGQGVTVPAGFVAQVIAQTFSGVTITTSNTQLCTVTISANGIYLITLETDVSIGSSTRILAAPSNWTGTATYSIQNVTAWDYARNVDTTSAGLNISTVAYVTNPGTIIVNAVSTTANATSARGLIRFIRLA